MKFNHIPKFPFASYVIDSHWGHLKSTLNGYKNDYGLDLNPIYQRGYKWSKSQKIAYLEYQMKGGFSGKDIFFNSKAWMYEANPIELVDGKQRINTVLEFLNNEIPVFGNNYFKDFDRLGMECRFKFHINSLETQKEVVEWYLGLNTGGSIHTEADLKPAYEYFNQLNNTK